MKRNFYFTGHRLTVFHWDGKVFTGACSFEPDDDGFLKFEKYLGSVANVRTKLLVDVIEEDFRVESVPHVYGKDKSAVTGRLLDRYYRSSNEFTYSEILGRQKTGRKDDEVLLGAITNPQLLEPWLEVIERCDVPLSGIWTLPLVSKEILPVLKVKSDAVLLVSQQVSSNLRQSFFKNKKFISSRTSVLNQGEGEHDQFGALAEAEISRTLSYLRGQGHIDSDEIVEVHVLTSSKQVPSLESSLASAGNRRHHIHDIAGVENDIGISGLEGNLSDGLFSWLCLKGFMNKGHYGKTNTFKQFYYSLASSALYVASIVTLIFSVLVMGANISESMEVSRSIELFDEQEAKFKTTYDTKFKEFESVLKNAKLMNASVDLANQIKKGSRVSPLDFFIEISRTLGDAKVGAISIDKIVWSSEQVVENKKIKKVKYLKTNLVLDYPIQHVAVLTGRIPDSSDDYRASVKRIHSIVDILKSNPRVESVKTLSMPVEVRSEKQFSADGGSSSAVKQNDDNQGKFSLEIRMKAYEDA